MNIIKKLVISVALLVSFTAALISTSIAGDNIHPNDAARFMAGMDVSASSPLAKYTKTKTWQYHSKQFNKAWKKVEAQKLSEAKSWASQNLTKSSSAMFYMFSGPDFLYANTFYPNAKTYILTGLEPVGTIPSARRLSNSGNLSNLRGSMNTLLNYSFFITKHMKSQLNTGFKGTVPVILVFMARSGKTIEDISYVKLDGKGGVVPYTKGRRTGVKITFSSGAGPKQTAYYFSTDLSNNGFRKSGLKEFAAKMGKGDALVKSASYLMHLSGFSKVRNFLLENTNTIVQDPSGIPLRYFDQKGWNLRPHGRYKGPIPIFKQHYQRDLIKFFKKSNPEKLKFGIGYRWRLHETNILLAKKK